MNDAVPLVLTAEKVTGNLAELTGQVAPCDVSSLYGIRKAMGITICPEPSEPFMDLTTGNNVLTNSLTSASAGRKTLAAPDNYFQHRLF